MHMNLHVYEYVYAWIYMPIWMGSSNNFGPLLGGGGKNVLDLSLGGWLNNFQASV